ncbi:O(6)-methylguanine-induced apoptosis 2 [Discoglossus pictus]
MEYGMRYTDPQERSIRRNQRLRYDNLQKGFRIPTTPSSIPTKYQTVFIPETERKGFSSGAQRFSYRINQNENPGPGSYNVCQTSMDADNVSLSKKGTGGFPSKVHRSTFDKIACTPAPNTYYMQDVLLSRKDFSKNNSSMFQQPIVTAVTDVKNINPAPNQYDASITYCHPNNNVSAHAAFASKTKRELVKVNHLKGPSPCHYTVNESFVKTAPKIIVSSFKSKTSRNTMNQTTENPGPAAYDPYGTPEVGKKIIFPRKHYLCFSAPAVPLPKSSSPPGPGHYEIVDYKGPPKHYISTAVFVSNTSRWSGDISGQDIPGPGSYYPDVPGKQSFLYNSDKKWIPA